MEGLLVLAILAGGGVLAFVIRQALRYSSPSRDPWGK